jgi:P27 family predicted phage terminase small subunit
MSGPPRTPTQLRRAKGNPGKRAYNKREPKLPKGRPDVPDVIADNKVALAEWNRLCDSAFNAEVLTKQDRSIVELAALSYAEYMEAIDEVKKYGTTYETTNQSGGTLIKANPAVAIRSDAWRRYRAAICELGFTPAARAKVSTVDPSEEEDPGEKYFVN